jgi:hypothetical protein
MMEEDTTGRHQHYNSKERQHEKRRENWKRILKERKK